LAEAASRPFIDMLEGLVNEFQWSGPIEIDCIRDKYTEAIYCIDINPRVPSVVIHVILGLVFRDMWVTKQHKFGNYDI